MGVLGRRGYPLESVVVRICREAGGRVTTNVLVRDLDLAEPNAADARRLEVVADGLPLFGGAQLAVDTTIVSTLHANGEPRRVHVDGVALVAARQRKERRYARVGRSRVVVPVWWLLWRFVADGPKRRKRFLSSLARAKARSAPPLFARRGWNKLGASDGVHSFPARSLGHWHRPS